MGNVKKKKLLCEGGAYLVSSAASVSWHNSLHRPSTLLAGIDMPYSTSVTVLGQRKQHVLAQGCI